MSHRIDRINNLIKKEVSKVILKELNFPAGVIVTVTEVETSSDLSYARVIISVIPDNKEKTALDILKNTAYLIQKIINKKLNIKFVPKISFEIDKSLKEFNRISKILEEIKDKQ